MTNEPAGADTSDEGPSAAEAAEAAERDALRSVRAVGEDRGDPDTARNESVPTPPSEVDPEAGTDADGFPVENPSG
ncbi:hypothetical protein HDC34_002367 [Pseudoclavibacter sp. JAI123]|uniref:hypothetical protein n=1 Tax=Pseudoclavibacter sp. JAI123 TaxID=2723065 RepID=UPI0015C9C998|nr:hypothetical protein [Pseudoclavibacter sp. JAI123]NYF14073.1 hypothetical protein [Pseudoclavibacter sp. JAI123]